MTIPGYVGNPNGPKVGILGDSLTTLSMDEDVAKMQDKYRLSILPIMGTRVDDMQGHADEFAASDIDIMVVELGTNDVLRSDWNGQAEFFNIFNMCSKFTNRQRLIWMNVDEGIPGCLLNPSRPYSVQNAQAFNSAVRYCQTQFPNMRIADWDSWVKFATGLWGRESQIHPDQIHPNQNGQNMIAYLIRQALDAA
jgi:hypothetical protein